MKLQNTLILLSILSLSSVATLVYSETLPATTATDAAADTTMAVTDTAVVETSVDTTTAPQQEEPVLSEKEKEFQAKAEQLWNSLDRKTGLITLPGDIATLNVPDTFYYLGPDDAEKVLVEAWGNPPSESKPLGMLMPASMTPYDSNSWAVTIEYSEEGYIKDDDADKIDYDDMLEDMKEATEENSKERVKQGYQSIALVGWAEPPVYDKTEKKLHWAKELKFGDDANHTLNYNIRILGRKGYLLMNFIAGMDQLPEIKSNVQPVLAIAEFNQGHRYSEFNPDLDKVAAYGLGGLIAGTAFVKTGLWAAALVFLKKFFVVIFIVIGAAWKKLAGIFKK
jgi:uncharacterized membrane-anchored protein